MPTVKKNNCADPVANSRTHRTASLKLSEANETSDTSPVNVSTSGPKQTTISSHLKKTSKREHKQLIKKFQLLHMTTVNAMSFNMYSILPNFEQDVHKVDISTSYTDRKSGPRILHYLSLSNHMQKITNSLNEDELMYYSVLFDGSSNAKTNNEKELFLIKTFKKGKPTFNDMSLEEVKDNSAPSLKVALEESIGKMSFSFDWKFTQGGAYSDGTNKNIATYILVKEDLGEHYLLILCPAYKLEQPITGAFKTPNVSREVQKDLYDIFYFSIKPT